MPTLRFVVARCSLNYPSPYLCSLPVNKRIVMPLCRSGKFSRRAVVSWWLSTPSYRHIVVPSWCFYGENGLTTHIVAGKMPTLRFVVVLCSLFVVRCSLFVVRCLYRRALVSLVSCVFRNIWAVKPGEAQTC